MNSIAKHQFFKSNLSLTEYPKNNKHHYSYSVFCRKQNTEKNKEKNNKK